MIMNRLMGFDYYYFLNCFFIYSFLGWAMECIVLSIQEKTLVKNTGFIRGPFCTIYGAGAMTAYYILKPVSENLFVLFFCGMLLASVIEYLTALLMLRLFGSFWWDYDNKPFNYKGILCLESSIGWGFLTVFLFKLLHPMIENVVYSYSYNLGRILLCLITIIYCLDFTTSFKKSHKAHNSGKLEEQENLDIKNIV